VTEARIRQAGRDDALVVAALTLQCAIHRGAGPEPGFLDRFATAWTPDADRCPAWIAEVGDEHAGLLMSSLARALPWPGQPAGGGALHLETFFVRPTHRGLGVGEMLLRTAVDWARAERLDCVQMRPGRHTRALCERLGLSASAEVMELRLDQR
jgi:GNAT superfamily N-acetyltransferase